MIFIQLSPPGGVLVGTACAVAPPRGNMNFFSAAPGVLNFQCREFTISAWWWWVDWDLTSSISAPVRVIRTGRDHDNSHMHICSYSFVVAWV